LVRKLGTQVTYGAIIAVSGKSSAATGKASCRYATPKSAKGKSLAGTMAITAKGKTITKRFSARLA
jgi:hypothetical protein